MKVYVAGSRLDRARVQELQEKIRDAGHTITHDWTRELEVYSAEELLALDTKQAIAHADYLAVKHADVFILINDPKCFGSASEFGMAIAFRIPCLILNREARENVFFDMPSPANVKAVRWNTVLSELAKLEGRLDLGIN